MGQISEMSAIDALDGSSTGIANDRCWHISAVLCPAELRPLSGVELPLDVGLAAIRLGTTALDAALDRQELTHSRSRWFRRLIQS